MGLACWLAWCGGCDVTDYSPLIGRLRANIEILNELNPDGTWKHSPLLQAYLRDHYCLTLSQADELDIYLGIQLESETANQRYKQLNVFQSLG